ncbi:HTH domain-containing protein [Cupriavidus necator]|uniref:HTH domain-containing protein n=1 Tax=Cupriavidus necator TaxID=106590 RepID=UPI0005B30A4A|nr:HTH domain-containing protein [Cupriavidus necator]
MTTARHQLIEAFRRGEEVIAARFAEKLSVSRQLVHKNLSLLEQAGAIAQQARGIWVLVDPDALPQNAEREPAQPQPQSRDITAPVAQLLAYFGIRLAEIDLPARRHLRFDQVPA